MHCFSGLPTQCSRTHPQDSHGSRKLILGPILPIGESQKRLPGLGLLVCFCRLYFCFMPFTWIDQKCPLLSLVFPGGHEGPGQTLAAVVFSRPLRFCVPGTMTREPGKSTHQCVIKVGFPCGCSQDAALLPGAASAQEWIPEGDRSGVQGQPCVGYKRPYLK